MTLHELRTYTVTCDGTLATACDASHPDRPHTCPATITASSETALREAMDGGRWTTSDAPWDAPGAQLTVHHCPTHRDQAEPS